MTAIYIKRWMNWVCVCEYSGQGNFREKKFTFGCSVACDLRFS